MLLRFGERFRLGDLPRSTYLLRLGCTAKECIESKLDFSVFTIKAGNLNRYEINKHNVLIKHNEA